MTPKGQTLRRRTSLFGDLFATGTFPNTLLYLTATLDSDQLIESIIMSLRLFYRPIGLIEMLIDKRQRFWNSMKRLARLENLEKSEFSLTFSNYTQLIKSTDYLKLLNKRQDLLYSL